jgi:hypothetical protein
MLYLPEFLEGEVPEADFYFWQGVGLWWSREV